MLPAPLSSTQAEAPLDYWTADEFHFGEMEMKRIAEPGSRLIPFYGQVRRRFRSKRLGGILIGASIRTRQFIFLLRRWWHEHLSLVALYRWGSDYGNNYQKPLAWLGAVLLLAGALYPLPGCGLQTVSANSMTATQTYPSVWPPQSPKRDKFWAEAKLAGKSLLTSIDVATFQKGGEYAPAYPWGRTISILEALLTSTVFALFLLAIRRQFRR